MALRFTLITAARCAPLLDERFDDGRSLDALGRGEAEQAAGRFAGLAGLSAEGCSYCSPSPRARQTGALLGLAPLAQPALRDCDMGRWAGSRLDRLMAREPAAVADWLADPRRTPYGGEPLPVFIGRVGDWLDTRPRDAVDGRVAAVVDPWVCRAAVVYALGAPPQVFWRMEAQPLSVVRISGEPGAWSVRFEAEEAAAPSAAL